jgi:hypothetical protein
MNTPTLHDDVPTSKMATGLKFAAVAAVLGLIVVTAQPGPGVLMSSPMVSDAPAMRYDGAAPIEYYPAHFAAPTNHPDDAPTF